MLGSTQRAILRTVSHGRAFIAATPHTYQACLKLHGKGLLDRDLGLRQSKRFLGNIKGTAYIIDHDNQIAARLSANEQAQLDRGAE